MACTTPQPTPTPPGRCTCGHLWLIHAKANHPKLEGCVACRILDRRRTSRRRPGTYGTP